jgi:dolichyl-phosphate beta-glucosyltransferase
VKATPYLSIVLPAYNEQELIAHTLDDLSYFLGPRFEHHELIVVDDGSSDDRARVAAAWRGGAQSQLHVLQNGRHQGKGAAARRGVLSSKGEVVVVMDSDLPYELHTLGTFIESLQNGHDLAIGSRVLPGSFVHSVPAVRLVAGKVYSWLIQMVLFRGVADTQCGFKCFTRRAAEAIFPRLTIPGFGFDAEALFVAHKLRFAIELVPVRMASERRRSSSVRLFRDSMCMFGDLLTIRWNYWRGIYDLERASRGL